MNESLAEDLEFLQHYGVKGQRWGVRKKSDANTAARKKLTKDQKKKVARAVGGVLVVAGGVAIGVAVHKHKTTSSVGKQQAAKILKTAGVKKVPAKPSPQATAWMKQFNDKQRELHQLANADLRAGYERSQTPLPLREYLPEWR